MLALVFNRMPAAEGRTGTGLNLRRYGRRKVPLTVVRSGRVYGGPIVALPIRFIAARRIVAALRLGVVVLVAVLRGRASAVLRHCTSFTAAGMALQL